MKENSFDESINNNNQFNIENINKDNIISFLEKLKLERDNAVANYTNLKMDFNNLKKEFDRINDEIQELNNEESKLEEKNHEITDELSAKDQELRDTQVSYHQKKSKLEAISNFNERYEGYGNSIRRVMEQQEDNKGIIGVVPPGRV